jgi:hypothetical protein
MGRPLAKRFFGNRNLGSASTTADDGIGGEGLASISNPAGGVGSFVVSNTYKNFPQLNIGAPTIPGGVQATADVVFEIDTVTFSSGGQTDGDYVAGLSTSITGLGGGAVVRIVETANKVTSVDLVGGNRGEFRRGDAFDGTGITTFQVLQAPNAGTDLQINITFRVKSITILEKGSGYVSAPTLSWSGHTFTGQTSPSLNAVTLTTDSGRQGGGGNALTNQENAIKIYAKTTSGGTAKLGDIQAQKGSHRYKIKTSDGTAVCKLVTTTSLAVGQAYLVATSTGGTYYVTKLTSRRAVLTTKTGDGALNGQSVKWTFGSPSATVVQIENA